MEGSGRRTDDETLHLVLPVYLDTQSILDFVVELVGPTTGSHNVQYVLLRGRPAQQLLPLPVHQPVHELDQLVDAFRLKILEAQFPAGAVRLAREVDQFRERPADVDGDVRDLGFVVRKPDVPCLRGGGRGGIVGWRAATGWRQLLVVYYVSFLDINLERISSLLSPGFGGGRGGGTVTYSDGARTVQLLKGGIFAGTAGLVEDERGDGGHSGVFMGDSRGGGGGGGGGGGRRRRRKRRK